MILVVHTLDQSKVQLAWVESTGKVLKALRKTVQGRQTEMVTPTIDLLLKKSKLAVSALSGIIVASGPGGFTAVRSGVVVANAFGFALGIPVVGVEGAFSGVDDLLVSDRFSRALTHIKRTRKPTQARPAYGAQPNISKAKRKKVQQHKLRV
ncbi:MAG: tRNA (adenosine(37)-N6)-threonylcarbamoyltransferase complex dimerization subunit type 1 TsaB [Patescibacteria group bacterium]